MSTYIVSDLHFNHAGILTYCPGRPYVDVTHMNASMIGAWDAVVRPEDEVFIVGDFAFVNRYGLDVDLLFKALPGHKHLIIGNHDEHNPKILRLPWVSEPRHYRKVRMVVDGAKRKAVLCHYPMETWDGAQTGTIMLHGHSHGTLKRVIPHRFDVGVDRDSLNGGFSPYPVPLEDYFRLADGQVFDPQDHHGD